MLSKQSPILARNQLEMTFERRKNQLDEILQMTNPAVRQYLLKDFSEDVDSAAVHLKAAALPRQRTQVILPMNSLKDNEIYAPNFTNGERVVLIRYPHGGTFEIPELTVNNRHPEAKKVLGDAAKKGTFDAVAINSKTASRLSGADFDGDTVLVIPQSDRTRIRTKPPLKSLEDFDPQRDYKLDADAPKLSGDRKQQLMGDVSNLITDMTIKGASDTELAAAVRHSMVVIDAEKHHLDYKRSAIDNGIPNLKRKYQGSARSGASTIVSRKNSKMDVPERKRQYRVDPETGKKIWIETNASYVDRTTGKTIQKTSKVVKLAELDAHDPRLSSGTPIERVYADHSNRMKALADSARKEMVNTKTIPYNASAAKAYSQEVRSLDEKLNLALQNAPRERQARVLAQTTISMKRAANPDMEKAELKKLQSMALEEARTRTGAKKDQIRITTEEWNAIQAGAISHHKLTEILKNADIESVKGHAAPPIPKLMNSVAISRAKQMLASGYTQAEVAAQLGVSLTTLKTGIA
jgi:DNA-binding NarL/FixJ family response regulator